MKILISHSWQDKSAATKIYESLEQDGHEVWYDVLQLVPGDNIQQVIDVYIKKCDLMVLLWSIHAIGSEGVDAEIETAHAAGKRIIPLLMDTTPVNHHLKLKGVLGIPMDDFETGCLLLRRALLLLMVSEADKEAAWFKTAFGNVKDLGGYLNYVNTYRLPRDLNNDGDKEAWTQRLEKLVQENEAIRLQLIPKAQDALQEFKQIMQQLEHGEVSLEQLNAWTAWCDTHQDFHPELVGKLKAFIEKDKQRLQQGGEPVHAIDFAAMEKAIHVLENAINHKKKEAYEQMTAKINSFGGWLLGKTVVNSIVMGYQNYVISSPKLMHALVQEAKISEFVAVKETAYALYQYMAVQDRQAEMQQAQFDGFFDDAYYIINAIQLLIEAKLVKREIFPSDPDATNLMNTYISYVMDTKVKENLDLKLSEIRTMIGLKKDEINWGQVALFVVGAAALANGIDAVSHDDIDGGASYSGGGTFEDNVADFSARNGGGLTDYLYP